MPVAISAKKSKIWLLVSAVVHHGIQYRGFSSPLFATTYNIDLHYSKGVVVNLENIIIIICALNIFAEEHKGGKDHSSKIREEHVISTYKYHKIICSA